MVPKPTQPPLTFLGEPLSPGYLVLNFRSSEQLQPPPYPTVTYSKLNQN